MRYALPLWHCISDEARDKLRQMAVNSLAIPPFKWVKWPENHLDIMPMDMGEVQGALEYYDKFMRRAPSSPARIK